MRHHHPIWRPALLVAGVLALVADSGCRNQQTPLANPFLAPDRVPPPSTRSIAPGTAQPYYPGDPLPSMQSAVAPPAATLTTAPAAASPTGSVGSPTIHAEPVIAAADDGPVAIPNDSDGLRFALATPAPTQVVQTMPTASGPPAQLAGVPVAQPVQPALYTSPPMSADSLSSGSADPSQSGPWRSPQVASTAVFPTTMPSTIPPTSGPEMCLAAADPSMSVRLRPVASPVPEISPAPRIRLPGYVSSLEPPVVFAGPVQQAAYVAPTFGGTLETVQITELPESGPSTTGVIAPSAAPAIGVASQPTFIAPSGSDGFRPRGSTR
jgi:hypothetical protein